MMVRIGPGAFFVSKGNDEILTAVLGSCVSITVYDPVSRIGGMNHFMLPVREADDSGPNSFDLRYGAHAIEVLINEILNTECTRDRIEVKVFGGANLIGASRPIGTMNVQFAEAYLAREGMSVVARDVGGHLPRRIEFSPLSGRVRTKLLEEGMTDRVKAAETELQNRLRHTGSGGDVDLF